MSPLLRSTYRRFTLLALLGTLGATACGDSGPSSKQLRDQLAMELPAYWEASSFSVEAEQNAGNEVEPVWMARFRAGLKLKEDTYKQERREGDVIFVSRVASSGEERPVYGKAVSGLRSGAWATSFSLENSPISALGKPLGSFDAPRVIIIGSDEEKAYQKEQTERKAARERAIAQLYSQSSFSGIATQGTREHPILVRFTAYDPTTKRARGEIEWPGLGGAIKAFEGTVLTNGAISAKEVDWVRRSADNVLFGIEYSMKPNEALDGFSGSWKGGWLGEGGKVTLTRG